MQRVTATSANIFGLAVAIPMWVKCGTAIILEINDLNNFIQNGICQVIDNQWYRELADVCCADSHVKCECIPHLWGNDSVWNIAQAPIGNLNRNVLRGFRWLIIFVLRRNIQRVVVDDLPQVFKFIILDKKKHFAMYSQVAFELWSVWTKRL